MSDMTTQKTPIKDLVTHKKILLVLGPGGVGKTTTSVALALLGASMGKSVGLLSIDPAKRLAAAMGISLGDELKRVPLQKEIKGSLHALMLDQASVFDRMVSKFSTPRTAEKIFNNSIYQQTSKNLGGPLEYMALAQLNDLIEQNKFDLLVLDTPPDTHAIDFLVKPDILAGFVEKGVMTWLIKPFHLAHRMGMGKILGFGERLMGGVAKVTGVKMLEKLSEFLVLMDSVIKGFNQSSQTVSKRLRDQDTGFISVLAPSTSSLRSTENIQLQLYQEGFPLDALIVNRVIPKWQEEALEEYRNRRPDEEELNWIFERLLLKLDLTRKIVATVTKSHTMLYQKEVPILGIPENENLIHTIHSILDFSKLLSRARSLPS